MAFLWEWYKNTVCVCTYFHRSSALTHDSHSQCQALPLFNFACHLTMYVLGIYYTIICAPLTSFIAWSKAICCVSFLISNYTLHQSSPGATCICDNPPNYKSSSRAISEKPSPLSITSGALSGNPPPLPIISWRFTAIPYHLQPVTIAGIEIGSQRREASAVSTALLGHPLSYSQC